ncbi:LCP family protein [Saccharopolyspora sp. K220]|nr:LCP family protein [Saccharopolyspora soli]
MAASLCVFLTLGIAWGATTIWGPPSIAALDPNSASIKDVAKQTGDQNFLLVGSDTRAGATASDGVGSEQDEPGARSDTTIIAHIPADRSRVILVSFPRDLQVDMPACERWDSTTGKYTGEQVPARRDVRLNEAYSIGGPLCTTKVIQQVSGLRVDSFLGIDFQGFKSMVDAVQGVEVCTEKPIIDTTLGTVLPTAGKQTLSGEQALNYVRARHVKGDPTSDYGRMQRQQLFLSALLRKTMSSQVLLDPGKLSNFVKAVSANTFGENIGVDRLMDLGQQLQGLDANRVTFVTVPTTGYANEQGMEVLRETDTKALFQAIIDGAPVTGDANAPQAAESNGVPSGGGANGLRQQPPAPDPNQPSIPGGLSTVNAGTDICG